MDRHIVHFDLDTFFVSVERLKRSELFGQPVIIGSLSDRGVVASCSYEARQFGVHSAMPARLARQLCPQAVWVRGDYDQYEQKSAEVTQIIHEGAPVFEKASIDEHYLDLTGMDRYFGCLQWTWELREKIIRETGLPISFGLSLNKTVSKVATGTAKPNGGRNVDQGAERGFLAPLSIRKLPGVGEKNYRKLRTMGVDRIQTLQQMPPELMGRVMGKTGTGIWQKANGIDNSPITPYRESKSMSQEQTFEKDTTDMELLHKTILRMVAALGFELRAGGRLASKISVKVRYANFDTHSRDCFIPYTSVDSVLTERALQLFKEVFSRRMLIRLVGVKLSGLVHGHHQMGLFDQTVEQVALNQAMDSIKRRFGEGLVQSAAAV